MKFCLFSGFAKKCSFLVLNGRHGLNTTFDSMIPIDIRLCVERSRHVTIKHNNWLGKVFLHMSYIHVSNVIKC